MRKILRRTLCALLLCALLVPCLTSPAEAASFTDVPSNHWTAPSIQRCVELGFFQGETATTFGLGHEMTRSAFIVVLSRFFGWETPVIQESSYEDVSPQDWYAPAVEAALKNGAITLQTSQFRPQEALTREELAVILTRVLRYHALAGLAQELPSLFEDVTTSPGYISLSQELGLVTGVTATSFAPDRAATREEVAVTLVRMYNKLNAASPERVGIIDSAADLPDLAQFAAVAVNGGQLISAGGRPKLVSGLSAGDTASVRAAAKSAGSRQLLYISGYTAALSANTADTAKLLAAAVAEGGYDGLFLDIQTLNSHKATLTDLAEQLRSLLADKLLYLAAEAPSWYGRNYAGYDYAALGSQADRLVLRLRPVELTGDEIPVAPHESPEEVYYALAQMNDRVDMGKVTLMLTTTADIWSGSRLTSTLSGTQAEALRAEYELTEYDAARYGCTYLSGQTPEQELTVWYLNRSAVAQRITLAKCFDIDQVCLSRVSGVTADFLSGLQ